jgi:ABC-type transport system involved in cytochrome c biogenesis ATPase subunit
MKKVLIASVGGSAELIVHAIQSRQPDFVYFLCSTGKVGSDETAEKVIAPAAGLTQSRYVIERVARANDLDDVDAACERIRADLATRFAGEELSVVANYTGGTKVMSVGLGGFAKQYGWSREWTAPPTRSWCGPIAKVELEEVTVFSSLEIACSPGINVIIGENGAGKTHLLKCAYALLRAAEEVETRPPVTEWGDKLERVLGGRARSALASAGTTTRVSVECPGARIERTSENGHPASWSLPDRLKVTARALFLPSREVLAMYGGFVKAYEDRELSFDETYYDLCKELSRRELREPSPTFSTVLAELEEIIGGRVRLDLSSFVIDTASIGTIPASMVAEGHRKLAVLAYLIKSGGLAEESVLFWDEPEANLNPKLIAKVAGLLHRIAKAGVQVFVATHDDLLAGELSLAAEHRIEPVADTLFFSLHRASGAEPVEVEVARRWGDLKPNAIVEAYAAHYDREHELFAFGPEEPSP